MARLYSVYYPYFNTYLFHWGSVLKFSPKGGKFWQWREKDKRGKPIPAPELPEDAKKYRSGYLSLGIAVQGAQWQYLGCSPVPTCGEGWGDPSCTCWNMRLAVDPFGRVYAPDVFRFSVEMIDTNGNQIGRIGRYGNVDDGLRVTDGVHQRH